ncbi:MAG: ABC transporter substrate-binding protein [Bacteroidales bacterium]|nr:ABC transporter substrate-binding protein [Bacteroidales bacterium]MBR1782195.1 ABC transporter substrate-binding protein [Bacteroidales bacterium]
MKYLSRILALLAGLSFYGMVQAQEKLVFTPQWTAQAQFAGYYVAQELGFYKDAGIEVEIVHPSSTESALVRLQSGKSQLTTIQLCQAMEFIDNGIPLVNILQTSMNNGLVIVSRNGKNPAGQKGIRVGTWSVGFDQIALAMCLKEDLDYQWVRYATSINLFLAGAIDAILAMSYNEYYLLKQCGVELTEENTYRFRDHGYNVQEDGVYMLESNYRKNKEAAQKFAQASKRGWLYCAEHPEEALEIVMKYVRMHHVATNRVMQKLQLEEVLKLQIDPDSGEREFRLRPDMVKLANDLMLESQLLLSEVTYQQIIAR